MPRRFSGGYADPTRSSRATAWGVGARELDLEPELSSTCSTTSRRASRAGRAGSADRPTEKSVQTRLQLSF